MFWDDPNDVPVVAVMLYGAEKTGKTHWACSRFPGPVYVADTENRAGFVVQKLVAEGLSVVRKVCRNMRDVRETVEVAAGSEAGTFVFDSASDLLDYAQDEFLRETEKDKIYPRVLWARVFEKIDALYEKLRGAGFNVVFLCREKEEWAGDKPTGRATHEGYKALPYKADVVLRHRGPRIDVCASGLARDKPKAIPVDMPWEELRALLSDDAAISEWNGRFKKKEGQTDE